MKFVFLLILTASCLTLTASPNSPNWMTEQIKNDLSPFQKGFSVRTMIQFFEKNKEEYALCLFQLFGNKIYYQKANNIPHTHDRLCVIKNALNELAQKFRLPNTSFLVCIGDTLNCPKQAFPIFVMSKKKDDNKVMFPDFEALACRYQVLENVNLETEDFPIPWHDRKDRIIWRGSGAEGAITPENMHTKSRVILCQLSSEYPDLIDAGFTYCIPACIGAYRRNRLSWEEIFSYRFQIWLDGNAASYSNSGWRLFSGSTVLKTDSPYTQWYFAELKPWVHYVPVKKDLSDLISTLLFLRDNPDIAAEIAQNGRQFAKKHLLREQNMLYFRDLISAYASLARPQFLKSR